MGKFDFKFIVSMDKEMVQKLDYLAEYHGRDRTNFIRWLVRGVILRFEKEHGKIVPGDKEKKP